MKKVVSEEYRDQAFKAFCSAIVLTGSLFLPCVELFSRNGGEFTFSMLQLFKVGSLVTGLVTFLLWMLLMTCWNWKHFDFLNGLCLATATAIWLQNVSSSLFLGEMDPLQADLSLFLLILMVSNAILLLTPFLLFFWKRKWCYRQHWKLTLILLAPQIVTATRQAVTFKKPEYGFYQYSLCEEQKFSFASQENIIVLVVDAMGEYIFREAWEKYPDLHCSLKDFTCFDRMVSPVPGTPWAIPAMLSGLNYQGCDTQETGENHAKYLKQACWSENSLLLNFRKLGYYTDAYPFILQTVCYDPELLNNVGIRTDHQQSHKIFMDTLYRQFTPLFLCPLLNNPYFLLTDPFVAPHNSAGCREKKPHDCVFYQQLNEQARIGEFSKGFKYLHLQGAHAFVQTNENLEISRNTNVVRQLRGSLKNLELLITKMKELGIYDQAMIVVTGDHSERYTPEIVSLIKRPGETHEQMQFNSLPGKISDLAGTVLAEKNLRPKELSLFSAAAVASSGESRLSGRPVCIPISNWKKCNSEDSALSKFNASNEPFYIKDKSIQISVPKDQQPIEVTFKVQNVHSGEIWESESCSPAQMDIAPAFYQLTPVGLPDGDYVLMKVNLFRMESESYWYDTPHEEQHRCSYYPCFLVLRQGQPSFCERCPGITPRPMQINEKIVFKAMENYPQLVIPEKASCSTLGLRFGENSILEVILPESKKDMAIRMEMKFLAANEGHLELYNDNYLLCSREVTPTSFEPFSVEFNLPGQALDNNRLKLHFRFIRKFKNRDRAARNKVHLASLQLIEKG